MSKDLWILFSCGLNLFLIFCPKTYGHIVISQHRKKSSIMCLFNKHQEEELTNTTLTLYTYRQTQIIAQHFHLDVYIINTKYQKTCQILHMAISIQCLVFLVNSTKYFQTEIIILIYKLFLTVILHFHKIL